MMNDAGAYKETSLIAGDKIVFDIHFHVEVDVPARLDGRTMRNIDAVIDVLAARYDSLTPRQRHHFRVLEGYRDLHNQEKRNDA